MKVAIVHDWIVSPGGSERIVLNWHELFPDATIYTLVYDKKRMGRYFADCDIRTTWMQRLPFSTKIYKDLLPLMPGAWERLDLTKYDLVLSSCSSCCKGVITRPDAVHICYCHTPTRYLWDMFYEYRAESTWIKRHIMPPLVHRLRVWDRMAADRVDWFIANSEFTRKRIKKYYRRDSVVIYGVGGNMVPENIFCQADPEDYYLTAGRLVAYKKVDLAIEVCNRLKKKLVVIGTGPEEHRLKKLSGPTIEFKGFVEDEELRRYYSNAKAFLFPALEDYGLAPVEAQSGGTPVLAYGRGGALDTVLSGKTGLFFPEQTVDSLMECVNTFERDGVAFSREEIRAHVLQFSKKRFQREFSDFVQEKIGGLPDASKPPYTF